VREVLEQLERSASGADLLGSLAYLAGHDLEHDADERYAAFRRAELLLATGGDPRRPIELTDRAVTTVASDLADPGSQETLRARLRALEPQAEGLPAVTAALRELGEDPELAWRVYAWALLAEHVAGG